MGQRQIKHNNHKADLGLARNVPYFCLIDYLVAFVFILIVSIFVHLMDNEYSVYFCCLCLNDFYSEIKRYDNTSISTLMLEYRSFWYREYTKPTILYFITFNEDITQFKYRGNLISLSLISKLFPFDLKFFVFVRILDNRSICISPSDIILGNTWLWVDIYIHFCRDYI